MELVATDHKRVLVGLGMTGLSCARYLANKQKLFSMVDSREDPPCLEEFKKEFPEVELHLGEISDLSLRGANELVVSPGVALEVPAIAKAMAAGVTVCGDIDLFRRESKAPIIAITGSNGKSTVTTLVGEMVARDDKKVLVGGNIGVPALELLALETPDFYVLELSSFQLERSEVLAAEVATVLNISADHMDRYADLQAYHQAKHKIFRECKQVVVNRSDSLTRPLVPEGVKVWSFGLDRPDFHGFGLIIKQDVEYLAFEFETLMPVAELKIAGRHNIENALAALAIGRAVGLSFPPMLEVLAEFKGLPHRCQYVDEQKAIRYYNDSKGTNVGATVAAINGFGGGAVKVVLIAGGESKDADFNPLIVAVKNHCRAVVLIGDAADELERLLVGVVHTVIATGMDQAVREAAGLSNEGDVVLLSPACASFDMFENYQQRGNAFVAAVHSLAGGLN